MITKRQILSLIALAIMVIASVACKKKPTDVGNLSVAEEAEQTPAPEFPSDSPNNKLTIDTNQGLIQFKGLSFKSGAYYLNGEYRKKIYYYADVKVDENSKPYISAITKSEDGEIIEDEGKFYDNENGKGAVYNLEGVRYESNNRNTAAVTFTEDGYLIIKFSNYGADITYSLIDGKTSESETEVGNYSKSELVGTWRGNYDESLTVDSEGNIHLWRTLSTYIYSWDYYGKTADTFNYPYTVEVVYERGNGESRTGTITFHNSSSCSISVYGYGGGYGRDGWIDVTSAYTK